MLVQRGRNRRAKESLSAPSRMPAVWDFPEHERAVIDAALSILRHRLRAPGGYAGHPSAARTLALLRLANRERECFLVLFLDAQLRVIATEELSQGTLTQTTVYPREVVRAAMRHNAAAVILAHNHPSGEVQPSEADKQLTQVLRDTLALVNVSVLDHLIVSGDRTGSFAELGLM